MAAPETPVRDHLVNALHADLVGPFYPSDWPGAREEVLPLPPSRWYLTGFLAPQAQRETEDPTAEDELGAGDDEDDEESAGQEAEPKQRNMFAASMGVSVLLPKGDGAGETIKVTVRFAEYVHEDRETEKADGKKGKRHAWRRFERKPATVTLPLDAKSIAAGVMVPDTAGIWVKGKIETAEAPGLESGTRALALFVVNQRGPAEDKGKADEQFIFQVEMEAEYERGLVARPNRQGEGSTDRDEAVADLQFRGRAEYAVGHGVAVEVPAGQGAKVTRVRTTWLPAYEVKRVKTNDEAIVPVSMDALAGLADGAAARTALTPLVTAYGAWLDGQAKTAVDSKPREGTRDKLVSEARDAQRRIAEGIERLATDADALAAFKLANEAMAAAARKRSPGRYTGERVPEWRLFQLAFVLLNIAGIENEAHDDRERVELIFFPTGGGKTEAYLGVIAFTLLLRRIRGQARDDKGLGVAVLLRYTLRLLTLDQLGRAASLICALEMLRLRAPAQLGDARFAVGLWVGRPPRPTPSTR
jgi:hypothetical protein